MDGKSSDPRRSDRLNDIRMHSYNGHISDEDKLQLVQWIYDVATKGISIEFTDIESVPNWYKPIMAWHQLSSMGANGAGTLMPWHIPTEWVEKLATAYMCTTMASNRVREHVAQQNPNSEDEQEEHVPHMHHTRTPKFDTRGGGSA